MKKNISILLIVSCILVISTSLLFAEQQYDFRKTNWGTSREQVKATENKKPLDEGITGLLYQVNIDSMDFRCVYHFLEDKLYTSAYLFAGKHINENLYIDDYKNLKETLTKKYSKPTMDKVSWKNDLFKSSKQDWGTAISIGHLVYGSQWETASTTIFLILSGDNYKISLAILYNSKELKEWADKILEEKAKSNF